MFYNENIFIIYFQVRDKYSTREQLWATVYQEDDSIAVEIRVWLVLISFGKVYIFKFIVYLQ